MKKCLTREDLRRDGAMALKRGRWGNADLYLFSQPGETWVIKDFSPCPPLIRESWGRLLVRHECGALSRLSGIGGIPELICVLDAYAFCYGYIPGRILRGTPSSMVEPDFFYRLEALVNCMHQRNLVHLDLRNSRNVLITESGAPALLDFQSSVNLDHVPKPFRQFLKEIDISGVYKLWKSKKPESMDMQRKSRLAAMNRKRGLWMLRGYPLGTRKAPRK